jgi:hypothetical protein
MGKQKKVLGPQGGNYYMYRGGDELKVKLQ